MATHTKKVKLVLFDMGDIIYDATAWRKWLHGYLSQRGLFEGGYWDLADRWEGSWLQKIHKGEVEYKDGFERFLGELGLNERQKEELLAVNWVKKKELEAQIKPFEGVESGLKKLKEMGLTTGILSDTELGEKGVKDKLSNRLHLDGLFDHIVTSADIGARKPEPEAFNYVVHKTGIPFEEIVFVAHDYDELEGALALGIDTIAFNYRENVHAVFYIQEFKELPNVIRSNYHLIIS